MMVSQSMSNSRLQAKMAFERLMRNHYEHWDNRDIQAYGKTLAHNIEMVHDSVTGGQVKYNGREDVTQMVAKYRESQDNDMFDEFRHEIKSYRYLDVKADRIQAEVKMFCWQRAKETKEWKQQLLEIWPVKILRPGRFILNITAELRNGEWLITRQKYSSELDYMSNSQMQAEMAFERLMRTRYEHWDNGDITAYSKSLAHDVEMELKSATLGKVNYNGKEDVTNMVSTYRASLDTDEFDGFRHEIKSYNYVDVKADYIQAEVTMNLWQRQKSTKDWKQQILQIWPEKQLRSGQFTLNAIAELRNGEWLITSQKYSSED